MSIYGLYFATFVGLFKICKIDGNRSSASAPREVPRGKGYEINLLGQNPLGRNLFLVPLDNLVGILLKTGTILYSWPYPTHKAGYTVPNRLTYSGKEWGYNLWRFCPGGVTGERREGE